MVTIACHDRTHFYKYYSAESAIKTLESTSRRWSTPLTFNDPFDNQFDLILDEPTDEIADGLSSEITKALLSKEEIPSGRFGDLSMSMEYIRQLAQSNHEFRAHLAAGPSLFRAEAIEGMKAVRKSLPEFNAQIFDILSDTSIFCISETNCSILMWSHYGLNHTGAVIKFLALEETDSPLLVARPVMYSRNIPRLDYMDLVNVDGFQPNLINMITLTKSDVWSYEHEWRIVGSLRDRSKTHEILPFSAKEIGAVYLGCKIESANRERIIQITRQKYPDASLFQAKKSTHHFSIEFELIT